MLSNNFIIRSEFCQWNRRQWNSLIIPVGVPTRIPPTKAAGLTQIREQMSGPEINFGLWAVAWAGLWEKRVWVHDEQLLRPVFSLFRGQKFF